mmetsp:Transcript_45613/g.138612  ORF Transcript_45613/g.138612 Transcript_45613/m.138612 type:complete len:561 (-) Transcript_45613:69-1751(-)
MSSEVNRSLGDFAESIKGKIDDVAESLHFDAGDAKRAGRDCHTAALDASALCSETISKATNMVDFANEIRSTLRAVSNGRPDASALKTIRDLVDGDRVKKATALATDLKKLSLQCVSHSVAMTTAMDRGMASLPDIIEDKIESKVKKSMKREDSQIRDIEEDLQEVSKCVASCKDANLFTVTKVGVNAFDVLTSKGEVCKEIFTTIKTFAEDVVSISDVIKNFEISEVAGKVKTIVKSMWRCLRLSSLIKRLSEEVGRLTRWIIDLFKMASSKLGNIWGALAEAKDCMAQCIQPIIDALTLCGEADEKSTALIAVTGKIKDELDNCLKVDQGSMKAVKNLFASDSVPQAISLASSLDDTIEAALKRVVIMISRVTDGFDALPKEIQNGMSEEDRSGTSSKFWDPAPADVSRDVQELQQCQNAIDKADIFEAVSASSEGFSGVNDKFKLCHTLLQSSKSFVSDCQSTIDSFLGVWDLNAAQEKLLEMCRLVHLGKMMKQVAEQVMTLISANIRVMSSARDKIKSITNGFLPDDAQKILCSCVSEVTENMDTIRDVCRRLQI